MDSILNSIKKLLGIQPEYKSFDDDIIMHINTTFMILNQMGVGPEEGFSIIDDMATWNEYCITKNENAVRTFIYLKVKLLFDPPTSSVLIESINKSLTELEWRLHLECNGNIEGGDRK